RESFLKLQLHLFGSLRELCSAFVYDVQRGKGWHYTLVSQFADENRPEDQPREMNFQRLDWGSWANAMIPRDATFPWPRLMITARISGAPSADPPGLWRDHAARTSTRRTRRTPSRDRAWNRSATDLSRR